MSHRSNQNNTCTISSALSLNTWNCQRWKPEVVNGTVVDCRTRDPEVISSNPGVGKRKSVPGAIRTIPPPIPLHQSKIPEIVRGENHKLLWHSGRAQSEQYHHQSLWTRVKYLKLSEVKMRSCHKTVVECRTRDPEIPRSNPSAEKRKSVTGPIRSIPPPIPLHQS